ncbi:ATP synthase F1 subunit delta [Thermoleophilia bacterium SCSIO 60948]|nr:ATP synthase F1 subunit delta [Thermoleophilia bacterium SCSIO 60948]
MDRIARAYADALFAVAKEKGILDEVREQLAQFVDALEENRDLRVFLFSPYFSSQEKRDGIARVIDGASEEFDNFLSLLAEKHRLPVLFRIRTHFEELWAEENKRLGVTLTSAIELDEKIVKGVGEEIERQTDRKIDLQTNVDEGILGGLVLRVGNMVLDASLRSRLERLRTEIARG